MGSITVRNVDDSIKTSLRLRAARHGWSMEQEAREILRRALQAHSSGPGFAQTTHQRFLALDVQELPIPKRRKFGKSTRSPW